MRRDSFLLLLLFIIMAILFLPDVFYNRLNSKEINFLEKKALDGNMTATHDLIEYYMHNNRKKTKFWIKKLEKLEREKEKKIEVGVKSQPTLK